ncbi:MAG: hypothetical protein HY233_13455 [Acidobacteriales bacterium]|nr:hypothetical protein [Terriglobales bacterium]
MNFPFAAVFCFALLLGQTPGMQPRVLLGGPRYYPCDEITIRDGHILVQQNVIAGTAGSADEKASEQWIRAHSLLPQLSIRDQNLYWNGKKVDLGKVKVINLYQAIPWQGGVLIYGRTIPRRGFFESWPFKGDFIEARDIEPYCAIFFDPNTLKGEDLWLNGKVARPFFVYPIPAE